MKPEDNKPDNELDAELDSIGLTYHRAETPEPPEMLDQAILNKARLAAKVKKSGWHFGGFRWVSAFATASVIVVSLALIMEQTTRPPLPRNMPSNPASATGSYEIDALSADDANETLETGAERAAASRNIQESRAQQSQLPERKIDLRDAVDSPDRLSRKERLAPAAAAVAAPAEQLRRNDEPVVEEGRTFLEKSESNANARDAVIMEETMAEKPVPESELAPVAASGAVIMPDPPPPEVWIRRIMRLKSLQLTEKFEKELAEFRKIYPDYELPEELEIE